MSRRCNKQNRISSLINKKPEKCLYEKQSIRKESLEAGTSKDSVTKKLFNVRVS